jgi:hypothetical protein
VPSIAHRWLVHALLLNCDKPPVRISLDLIGHLDGKVDVGTLKTGEVRFLSDLRSREYYKAISMAHFMLAAIGEREYFTSRATSSVPAALIAHVPLVTSGEFLDVYSCLSDAPIHRLIAGWEASSSVGASAAGSSSSVMGKSGSQNKAKDVVKRGNRILASTSSNGSPKTMNSTSTSTAQAQPRSGRYRTECEAMEVVLQLSDAQYEAARAEIAHCSQLLWEQAKDTFRQLLARSATAGTGAGSGAGSKREGKANHALTQ